MKLVVTNWCVKSPRHLSHTVQCGWDFIDDTSGKLLNNTRVEKARTEDISVIRELGVLKVVDRACDEVVFGTRWVDINKSDEHKPFYRSRLVVQEYKGQADWSLFTAIPPLETLRSLLICATIDELPNEMGQPVAWTEPVVLIVFVELPAEAGADESKAGRLLRSMYGCRDAWCKLGLRDLRGYDRDWICAR